MAWTNPPTFSTDDVLSASNLNILSDDLSFLHGYVSGANPAMTSVVLTVDGDCFFVVRHLHRYMRILYMCQNDIKVYYDSTEVFHDGAPNGSIPESTYVDLNSFGLTVGQLYTIRCLMDSGTVYFIYESDTN
jgi:hypothetical protein